MVCVCGQDTHSHASGRPPARSALKAAGGAGGGTSIARAWPGLIPGDQAGGGGVAVIELGSGRDGAERIPEESRAASICQQQGGHGLVMGRVTG